MDCKVVKFKGRRSTKPMVEVEASVLTEVDRAVIEAVATASGRLHVATNVGGLYVKHGVLKVSKAVVALYEERLLTEVNTGWLALTADGERVWDSLR